LPLGYGYFLLYSLAIAIVIGLVKENLNLGILFVHLGKYPFC